MQSHRASTNCQPYRVEFHNRFVYAALYRLIPVQVQAGHEFFSRHNNLRSGAYVTAAKRNREDYFSPAITAICDAPAQAAL